MAAPAGPLPPRKAAQRSMSAATPLADLPPADLASLLDAYAFNPYPAVPGRIRARTSA